MDLAWLSSTIRFAIWLRVAGCVGLKLPPGLAGCNASLQMSTISSKKRLSKTPSLPKTMMSPSYAETQWTALPRSMTSKASSSSKSGSTRSSTRANCKGVCTWPSMRCISVWNTACKPLWRPCKRRNMSNSQSPIVSTATIGCNFPWILVLLSKMASNTVVEPRLSVSSYASFNNDTGPRYASCGLIGRSGMSCDMPSSSQVRKSSLGNSDASMPNSSSWDTPSATPSNIGDANVASASLWPFFIFPGCVF
mmetsp:Transcript_62690/g.180326  ORF Transcript_62690/g.180326 Transcript_62690/m.180326 type:complete len:251 (-) Transcript_62690:249-1001(-)